MRKNYSNSRETTSSIDEKEIESIEKKIIEIEKEVMDKVGEIYILRLRINKLKK